MDISHKKRIPRIQFTELKKVNKQKGPSEDASVPLGREKKIITKGEGRRDLEGKVNGCGGRGHMRPMGRGEPGKGK